LDEDNYNESNSSNENNDSNTLNTLLAVLPPDLLKMFVASMQIQGAST